MTEAFPHQGDPAMPDSLTVSSPLDQPTEVVDFVDNPYANTDAAEPPRSHVRRVDQPACWYLGIAEATGWFFGTLLVHLGGGIAMAIGLIIVITILKGTPPGNLQDSHLMILMTGGEMVIFVLASVVGATLRYWGRTFDELNLSLPDFRHVLIVVGGTLPMTFCVSAWSMPIQLGWNHVTELYPSLKIFDGLNTMELVNQMAQNTPLWLMILIVAVLPAIGEEIVFRGVIGRVLIAHLGLWGGLLLTSFMFGWIHIHPVHALSVMPLGLAIHLIYLSSKSFWLPMLLHFLNNCWASIAAQSGAVDPLRDGTHITVLESIEIFTAVIAVVSLGFLLWQSRVKLVNEDGSEWNAGRFPIRVPAAAGVRRESGRMNAFCWPLALFSVIVCHLAVVLDLLLPLFNGL